MTEQAKSSSGRVVLGVLVGAAVTAAVFIGVFSGNRPAVASEVNRQLSQDLGGIFARQASVYLSAETLANGNPAITKAKLVEKTGVGDDVFLTFRDPDGNQLIVRYAEIVAIRPIR